MIRRSFLKLVTLVMVGFGKVAKAGVSKSPQKDWTKLRTCLYLSSCAGPVEFWKTLDSAVPLFIQAYGDSKLASVGFFQLPSGAYWHCGYETSFYGLKIIEGTVHYLVIFRQRDDNNELEVLACLDAINTESQNDVCRKLIPSWRKLELELGQITGLRYWFTDDYSTKEVLT